MHANSDKQQSWHEDNCVCGLCASLSLAGARGSRCLASFERCCFSSLAMTATLLSFPPHACHGRLALLEMVLFFPSFFFFFAPHPSNPSSYSFFSPAMFLAISFLLLFFLDSINSVTWMKAARQSKQWSPWVLSNLSQYLFASQQALRSFCQHRYCRSWWWWGRGWWWGWGGL